MKYFTAEFARAADARIVREAARSECRLSSGSLRWKAGRAIRTSQACLRCRAARFAAEAQGGSLRAARRGRFPALGFQLNL